jgi:hypothetical protein
VINKSRNLGKILASVNATFIALIPKYDSSNSFDEYRPISLCNYIYKIIANIIALRDKRLLSKFISNGKFGFLLGRQIHNEIVVAWEGFHSIKHTKFSSIVIRLKFSKACDRES